MLKTITEMIYAVEILDMSFVKIGFSANSDVNQRISELQTGNPFQINPLLTVDGTLRQEKSLHAALIVAFGRIRVPMPPNEWYPGRQPFMRGFIESLKYGFDAGFSYATSKDPSVRQGGKKGDNFQPNYKWPKKA